MTAITPEATSLLLTLRRQTVEVHTARQAAHAASRARFLTIAELRGLGVPYSAIGAAMGLTKTAAQRLVETARERHPDLMPPKAQQVTIPQPVTTPQALGAGATLTVGGAR